MNRLTVLLMILAGCQPQDICNEASATLSECMGAEVAWASETCDPARAQQIIDEGCDAVGSGGKADDPAEAVEAAELTLKGWIAKNNDNEVVSFDVTLGGDTVGYSLKGSTSTDRGVYHSALDFSFVEAKKQVRRNGLVFTGKLANSGSMDVYPRVREIKAAFFAGVSVQGSFIAEFWDESILLEKLTVDGVLSHGELDFNPLNGHYNAKDNCSFGNMSIRSSVANEIYVLDYDAFTGQNAYQVTMAFGDLVLSGRVNFTDTTRQSEKQNVVAATRGDINVIVVRADGTPFRLSLDPSGSTDDETKLKKLLAFWELMAFDMFAE